MSSAHLETVVVAGHEKVSYFVNGEQSEHEVVGDPDGKNFRLTEGEILESAGFKPVEEWQLTRNKDNYTFVSPKDLITLENGEQITATF